MDNGFVDRLKMAMQDVGISASDLSRASGVSKSDISYYLSGRYKPKQDKCYLLAKALNVDPGWLMTGVEQTPLHALVNNAIHAGMVMGQNIYAPKTREARIIAEGIDRMEQEKREQAVKLFNVAFPESFAGSDD